MIPTPFETNNRWTTLAEEGTFLTDLAAAATNVTVATVGASHEGRPLKTVTVGTAGKPVGVLVIGTQHGHEPASREAAFQGARDLAFTTTPSLVNYLANYRVMFLPTASPDGLVRDSRYNAQNVDINRDHLALISPEARAIGTIIRDARPPVILDLHEVMTDDVAHLNLDAMVAGCTQEQADSTLRAVSEQLYAHVRAHLSAVGLTSIRYAGGNGPANMRNYAGLRHAVTLLVESDGYVATPARRVTGQIECIRASIDFHIANTAPVAAAIAGSRARKTREGELVNTPFSVGASRPLDPPPPAYRLTTTQAAATVTHRDILGIQATARDGGWLVAMGQEAQPLIPFILDPTSPDKVTDATRTRVPLPPADAAAFGPLRINGSLCEVTSVELVVGGAPRPIWTA